MHSAVPALRSPLDGPNDGLDDSPHGALDNSLYEAVTTPRTRMFTPD